MSQTTQFFIDIIETFEGVRCIGHSNVGNTHARKYIGLNGRLVIIDTTDLEDDIPDDIAIGYLKSLGLEHLKQTLYPDFKSSNEF